LGYLFKEPKIIAQTGWTTTNLTNAIVTDSDTNTYDFVFLLIGVNNQYQGKSVETYKTEFTSLLNTAIQLAGDNANHVFVISIPDYGYTPFGERSNQTKISADIDSFNAANGQISCSYSGVNYVDITPISRKGIELPSYVANDGLHPSSEQYGKWVDKIVEVLVSKLPEKQ
jgi:lysophospholipase L1-like esterase